MNSCGFETSPQFPKIMNQESKENIINLCVTGYTALCGIKITEINDGHSEGYVEVRPELLNPFSAVHGGLTATLMDTLGGIALRSLDIFPMTVSLTVNYIRSTIGIKTIKAEANVVKPGKTYCLVEMRAYNEDGVLIANAVANYANVIEKYRWKE